MKKLKIVLLCALVVSLISGCAIQKLPSGGDKDTSPPELISSNPENQSLHINEKRITLEFNEFVKLENESKELIFSPTQKNKPKITVKGKSIIIDYVDSLSEATTYTVSFGNAIKDITEGNILKNYIFVFSTGNEIDSLSISGMVRDAYSLQQLEDVKILLYKNFYDSIIYKSKPDYFTRTGEEGTFEIKYLSPGNYTLICLEDKNENLKYDPSEKIGFLKDSILLEKDTGSGIIDMFVEAPEQVKVTDKKVSEHSCMSFTFNRIIASPVIIRLDNPLDTLIYWEYDKRDSLKVWFVNDMEEKSKFVINNKEQIVDTITFRTNIKKKALKISKIEDLSEHGAYRISFNYPVDSINYPEIIFMSDTVMHKAFSNLHRVEGKITAYELDSIPEAGKSNFIVFPAGSIKDIFGEVNDTIKVPFRVVKVEDLGEIRLILTDTLSRSMIVELLDEKLKSIRKTFVKGNNAIEFKNLKPGNYRIKIIMDENNNKVWDTGDVLARKFPEKVLVLDKVISLKANWEIEETVTVP